MRQNSTMNYYTTSYEELPLFLTVPEVMAVLRLGRNTTYDLIHNGQLPSCRLGNQIRIPKAALAAYMVPAVSA